MRAAVSASDALRRDTLRCAARSLPTQYYYNNIIMYIV